MSVASRIFGGRGYPIGNRLVAGVSLLIAFGWSQAFAQQISINFGESVPGLQTTGTAEIRADEGNPGGYLSVTDAANGQHGALMFFPEQSIGGEASLLSIKADLRVGGGTDRPADGFSFNFARPDDPVFQEPVGVRWASTPFEANLHEEGTRTGLAIGFDEYYSGGEDVIGLSIRIDNQLV